jgi:hypothetical protein
MGKFMNLFKYLILLILSASFVLFFIVDKALAQQNTEPIKALMITGGGPFHDYYTQKEQLRDGLIERIGNIEITIDHEGGESMDFKFSRQLDDEWAKVFDVVIYNNCNLDMGDAAQVEKIMSDHVKYKVPAVITHCPFHLHRTTTEKWYDFTGAISYQHEVDRMPFTVETMDPTHPIMVNFPGSWRTPKGELYMPVELKDNATPIARAYGDEGGEFFPVVWTHEYEGVRVYSNTLGHHNVTMGSDVNLNLVASGLLWAVEKLNDDGTPHAGYSGERGLGWVSLWNAEDFGETLHGWRSSETTDWGGLDWFSGNAIWPTVNNHGDESFSLTHADGVDHNTIVVDGPEKYLYYQGAVDGGDFQNFEFKTDVYTYPESNSGIFFHTRFKDEGGPTFGYEADINTIEGDGYKTGGINPGQNESGDEGTHMLHEYFEYYISVDGKKITTKVNGETVTTYTEPSGQDGTHTLGRGTIALQSSNADGIVYFKNLLIRVWPD